MKYLYIETKGDRNFRIEIGEHETRPDSAIVVDFIRNVQQNGFYYHGEDKAGFPWHSIVQVTLKGI